MTTLFQEILALRDARWKVLYTKLSEFYDGQASAFAQVPTYTPTDDFLFRYLKACQYSLKNVERSLKKFSVEKNIQDQQHCGNDPTYYITMRAYYQDQCASYREEIRLIAEEIEIRQKEECALSISCLL